MADVLDSVESQETTLAADFATLMASVNQIVTDFNALKAGSVATTDPRWTTLGNQLTALQTGVTQLNAAVQAADPTHA